MKKALLYALTLALTLSLTACGQPKAEQPTDPAPSTSSPVDASTQEPAATPEPIKDTAPKPEPEQTPAAPVETEDTQPSEETEAQEAEQVQLFTDVNEIVYATGTVNIRASYTADSEKLSSLNKGDSATRTCIAIAGTEAEGWSRVELSDGSIVYVSNQYLSTTKPVVQQQQSGGSTQSKPGGGQQQTQQSEGSQQPTTPQQPTDSSGLTPEEQAIKDKFLKDNEEAKANGANMREGDPLSDEDIAAIGAILNSG